MSIPVGLSASSVDRWVARTLLPTITTNRCIFFSLSIKKNFFRMSVSSPTNCWTGWRRPLRSVMFPRKAMFQ